MFSQIICLAGSLFCGANNGNSCYVSNSNFLLSVDCESIVEEEVYDINCKSKYTLLSLPDYIGGFALFEEDTLIIESLDLNPYFPYDNYVKFYFSESGKDMFFVSDGINIWDVNYPNVRYNVRDYFDYSMELVNDDNYGKENKVDINALQKVNNKIDNWEFFFKSSRAYGWNNDGDCGTIAIQIILNYYDSFYCDDYIPEIYDHPAIYYSNSTNWKSWDISPGSGWFGGFENRANDDEFEEFLNDIAAEFRFFNRGKGMVGTDVVEILKRYKEKINNSYQSSIKYDIKMQNGGIACWSEDVKKFTKGALDKNIPVILGGGKHYAVAYAYDNDYVYLCNGWGYNHKAKWKDFYVGTVASDAIYIEVKNEHSHSNNYFNSKTESSFCTCGIETIKSESFSLNCTYGYGVIRDTSSKNLSHNSSFYEINVENNEKDEAWLLIHPIVGKSNLLYMKLGSYIGSNCRTEEVVVDVILYDSKGEIFRKHIMDYSKIYRGVDDEIVIQYGRNVNGIFLSVQGKDFKLKLYKIRIGCHS